MKTKALKGIGLILTLIMLLSTLSTLTISTSAQDNATPPTREIDGKIFYELDSAEDYKWFVDFCNSSVDPTATPDRIIFNGLNDAHEYHISYNAILTGNITLNENVIVDGVLNNDILPFLLQDP